MFARVKIVNVTNKIGSYDQFSYKPGRNRSLCRLVFARYSEIISVLVKVLSTGQSGWMLQGDIV